MKSSDPETADKRLLVEQQLRFIRDAILMQPIGRWTRTITEFGEVPALEWRGLTAILVEPLVPSLPAYLVRHPEDRAAARWLACCVGTLEVWHRGRQVLSLGWSATDHFYVFHVRLGRWSADLFGLDPSLSRPITIH